MSNMERVLSRRTEIEDFFGELPLMSASLRVTKRCNIACGHCYANASRDIRPKNELTLQELMSITDQLADLGTMEVFFTGGEPLARREDLIQTMQFAHQRGLRVLLSSNGVLVNESFLDRVRNIPFKLFQVSLDGPEPVHDSVRGANVYKRATAALRAASLALRANVTIGTVLMKPTADTLDQVMVIGHELGADTFALMLLIPSGRADSALQPTPLEQQKALDRVFQKYRELGGQLRFAVNTTLPPALVPADLRAQGLHKRFALCSFPYTVGIEANGDVAPCDGFFNSPEFIAGNVRETPLREIWQRSAILRETRQVEPEDLKGVCANCIFKHYCAGGCRAAAYLASARLDMPDPVCQRFYEAGLFPSDCLQ